MLITLYMVSTLRAYSQWLLGCCILIDLCIHLIVCAHLLPNCCGKCAAPNVVAVDVDRNRVEVEGGGGGGQAVT